METLQCWCARRHELAAGSRVSSERDDVNARVRGELGTDLWARPRDHVHHSVRESNLACKFGEPNRRERRCARRLHDNGIPCGECWGCLPDGHGEWVVPRCNQRCDTDWLSANHGGVAPAELRSGATFWAAQHASEEAQVINGGGDVAIAAQLPSCARLPDLRVSNCVRLCGERIGKAKEEERAVGWCDATPRTIIKRRARGGDCGINVCR